MSPVASIGPVAELSQDMHVHSTFSDGQSTIAENLEAAECVGLTRICCVDHVRRDTSWVADFVAAVRDEARGRSLEVLCGIEAKMLDSTGRLDLPADRRGIDFVFIADHQVPLADGPHTPAEIRAAIAARRLSADEVMSALVDAMVGALELHPGSVLAHAFSILPKIGISEADVPPSRLAQLAAALRRTGALVEIAERWRCPSLSTARVFANAGVPIVFSTDSHRAADIGRFRYARTVREGLLT